MLTLKTTAQFRKDYKLAKKRGYKMDLLEEVLQTLLEEKPLDKKHLDHALTGNYIGFRECHIMPDWLLIYEINKSLLIFIATRTGHIPIYSKNEVLSSKRSPLYKLPTQIKKVNIWG